MGPFAPVRRAGARAIVGRVTPEPERTVTDEPASPVISPEGRRLLLTWARSAVEAAVRRRRPPLPADAELTDELRAPGSAFVTLTERGELRGCMGRLDDDAPAWENVVSAAASAAMGDPRFEPVAPDELPSVRLEVSVLGPAVEIADPGAFDPERHGVVVERGMRRALLLPQVAREQGWGREETLAAVCWKAGLDIDAWRDPRTRLEVFTATVFGEEDGAAPAACTRTSAPS